MGYKLLYFLLLVVLIFVGCTDDDTSSQLNLSYDWDCVAYAKYQEGESITFVEGQPYWHLWRYSQGFTVVDDVFYHRYRLEGEPNFTEFDHPGEFDVLNNSELLFTIDSVVLQAEIIEISENHLWLKYAEGGYTLEFKYVNN